MLRAALIGTLLERFERRVVVVEAGPGFGKSTLLAQAVAENQLAPRGHDVWLTCVPDDGDSDHFAEGVATALGIGHRGDHASAIAEAVWSYAPQPVAIVLDDAHHLASDAASTSAVELLTDLVVGLPENGHVLMCGRATPPIALARFEAGGEVVRVDESMLCFDESELARLAELRDADVELMRGLGGWPALAALTAAAGASGAARFVTEELLARLPDERRHRFARFALVGGGDDVVASGVAGVDLTATELVAGLPLVAHSGATATPHPLWHELLAGEVSDSELRSTHAAVGERLAASGDVRGATDHFIAAGSLDRAAATIVETCSKNHVPPAPAVLTRWAAALDREGSAGTTASLLHGLVAKSTSRPDIAHQELETAMQGFAANEDAAGECCAIAHLAHLAWTRADTATLARLVARAFALDAAGVQEIGPLVVLARALIDDLQGNDEALVDALGGLAPDALPRDWQPVADWFRASVMIRNGFAGDAIAPAEAVAGRAPDFYAAQALPYTARWIAAQPDLERLRRVGGIRHQIGEPSTTRDRVLTIAYEAAGLACVGGDLDDVAVLTGQATELACTLPGDSVGVAAALARATLAILQHDDIRARSEFEAAATEHDLASPAVDRLLRLGFAVVYVLVPDVRPRWDALELGPDLRRARDIGRAFVAAREASEPIRFVPKPIELIVQLPLPWACEYAARALAAGSDHSRSLVEGLLDIGGSDARACLRALANSDERSARSGARTALGQVAVPPREPAELRLLGPTELRRAGAEIDGGDWKRERVRSLFALLVASRSLRRESVADTLWPELDERAASHNLSVTLNYLHGVLEPERGSRDASYFVVQTGPNLTLLARPELTIDVWELETGLDAAEAADMAGTPSVALRELLAATEWWRSDPFADWPYEEWAESRRTQLRTRFVAGALRAAVLLVARGDARAGDASRAGDLAQMALAAEPWSEPAYCALAESYSAGGDVAAALRTLDRCDEMLGDLGVRPGAGTLRLRERLGRRR